jgi:hypothetical protein
MFVGAGRVPSRPAPRLRRLVALQPSQDAQSEVPERRCSRVGVPSSPRPVVSLPSAGRSDPVSPSSHGLEVAAEHARKPLAGWATAATFPAAVRGIEEVVPVNAVSTWVLPSGVTVGR